MLRHISAFVRSMLARGYELTTPGEVMEEARRQHRTERYQTEKPQTFFTYTDGPMYFLGQQIVKAMQLAGYPCEIHQCYRPPEKQAELYAQGRTSPGKIVTRAPPYASAHQTYEAVDLIHPERGWNVSPEYWDTLAACVVQVSERFGVELDHGHNWGWTDSAHVELMDWKQARDALREKNGGTYKVPDVLDLWERFQQVLPSVAKQYVREHFGPPPVVQNALAMDQARRSLDT